MHVRRDEASKIHQTQLEEFAESARLRNLEAEDKTVIFVGDKEPRTSRSYEDLEVSLFMYALYPLHSELL